MTADTLHDALLSAWDAGQPMPEGASGQIDDQAVWSMLMATIARRQAGGAKLVGWKIGGTNRALREERGEQEPAPGGLFESVTVANGGTLEMGHGGAWFLEPELVVVMGKRLQGAADRETVRAAVAATACGFELVHRRAGWEERTALRSVNGSTAGHVIGAHVAGCPQAAALDELMVTTTGAGQTFGPVRGGDVNDNPLDSVAWLAEFLARHDEALLPGQVILTGTYSGLLPMDVDQDWHMQIADWPAVTLHTQR